jgi:hypothetical protein
MAKFVSNADVGLEVKETTPMPKGVSTVDAIREHEQVSVEPPEDLPSGSSKPQRDNGAVNLKRKSDVNVRDYNQSSFYINVKPWSSAHSYSS